MIPIYYFPVFVLLIAQSSPELFGEDKNKPVEAPTNILFDSEAESARYLSVSGSWRAYEFEGEQMIRLTPEPVQQCRVELGELLKDYHISITAKVLGKERKRLKPRMGVGIFGEYGFTLRIAAGKNQLELVQYGEVIAASPFNWVSAQWHFIELEMEPEATFWRLSGRVWPSGSEKPATPQLVHDVFPSTLTHSLYGRAFLVGSPFNGLPLFFDKVEVRNTSRNQ